MNLNTILNVNKKATSIAIVGIVFPILVAPCLYALFQKVYGHVMMFPLEENTNNAYILWTLILTVTSFAVVAHTLFELKLLYTGLGKEALTTTMIGDTYGWILFTLFVPFSINGKGAIYTLLCTIIFIVVCIFVVRPLIQWFIDRKANKDEWNDNQLLFIIMGVLPYSCISNFLGAYAIVGAFIFGLILPHGKFSELVMSISDDRVSGFLVPLFFSETGMRLMSQEELESIHNTFDALGEAYNVIRVETLNAMSAYTTIHEDIYHLAEEKCTSLILLPFHKQLTLEGTLEGTSVVYKDINQNVMQCAPCSVGIFVDRDFGLVPKMNLHIRVVFVGGPDDREALAIAWRMAGRSGTQLSLVRILLLGEAAKVYASVHNASQGILSTVIDTDKQKELDEEYIELGVIGDILVSNNFGSRSSMLVVQQYGYGGM
ncbi:hypothetical protein V8G54_028120, partial [Vigna mungo]